MSGTWNDVNRHSMVKATVGRPWDLFQNRSLCPRRRMRHLTMQGVQHQFLPARKRDLVRIERSVFRRRPCTWRYRRMAYLFFLGHRGKGTALLITVRHHRGRIHHLRHHEEPSAHDRGEESHRYTMGARWTFRGGSLCGHFRGAKLTRVACRDQGCSNVLTGPFKPNWRGTAPPAPSPGYALRTRIRLACT